MSTLLNVEGTLQFLELIEEALEGDGSTPTMPDVTPSDAARWILSAIDKSPRFRLQQVS